MPGTGAAGVLLLVERKVVPIFKHIIMKLNSRGRVSDEVLSLHLVRPSMRAVMKLSRHLCKDPVLADIENIDKLKPNNGLKDLIGKNRLHHQLVMQYMLVVGIETVTDKFRNKYPNPNVTLQAGSIEHKESTLVAALRELSEEARVFVHWTELNPIPIRLLGGGLVMYPCEITSDTLIRITPDSVYVGKWGSSPPAWIMDKATLEHRQHLRDSKVKKSAETEDLL